MIHEHEIDSAITAPDGKEAEELRAGIKRIVEKMDGWNVPDSACNAIYDTRTLLIDLLDTTDARDSLAYSEVMKASLRVASSKIDGLKVSLEEAEKDARVYQTLYKSADENNVELIMQVEELRANLKGCHTSREDATGRELKLAAKLRAAEAMLENIRRTVDTYDYFK